MKKAFIKNPQLNSKARQDNLGMPVRQKVKIILLILLTILFVLTLLSTFKGFVFALQNSQDFQWSPTRIFMRRENPYDVWLSGNLRKEIIMIQIPNYAQLLYILLVPFAALSFPAAKIAWAGSNIFFAVLSFLLGSKIFELSRRQSFLGLFIFIMARPTRHALGVGQHCLMVLFFFMLALFLSKSKTKIKPILSSMFAGLAYIKYSFAPSLGAAFLRKFGWRYFLLSFVPVIFGLLFFSVWANEPLSVQLILQPLRVSSGAIGIGAADLLSVLRTFLPSNSLTQILFPSLCLLLAGAAPFLVNTKCNSLVYWSFVSVSSLTFVTHQSYDYVFYMIPLIYSIKFLNLWTGRLSLALVIYVFFVDRVLISVGFSSDSRMLMGFMVNIILLSLLLFQSASPQGAMSQPILRQKNT